MKPFAFIAGIIIANTAVFAGTNESKISVSTPNGQFSIRMSTATNNTHGIPDPTVLSVPENIVKRIRLDLRVLRTQYIQKLYLEHDRQEALSIADEIEDLTALLYKLGFKDQQNNGSNTPPPPPPTPAPMSEERFASLLGQLDAESFSDDKLDILHTSFKDNYFSVSQVSLIMDRFDMDDNKVQAVAILYPHIVDRENCFKLLTKVTFGDSKDRLKEIITKNDK